MLTHINDIDVIGKNRYQHCGILHHKARNSGCKEKTGVPPQNPHAGMAYHAVLASAKTNSTSTSSSGARASCP